MRQPQTDSDLHKRNSKPLSTNQGIYFRNFHCDSQYPRTQPSRVWHQESPFFQHHAGQTTAKTPNIPQEMYVWSIATPAK